MNRSHRILSPAGRPAHILFVAALPMALLVTAGCERKLIIEQDPYINTAMQQNRPPEQRTGEPLEVAIVCVLPKDLDRPQNADLKRETHITCKDWWERCPPPGYDPEAPKEGENRFRLDASQIYVLTDKSKSDVYGEILGPALKGANVDGTRLITRGNIKFDTWALHDDKSVIYIFPKFIGPRGEVLPCEPVKLDPPGGYEDKIQVRVGVKSDQYRSGPRYGQFIEIQSERKMHKRDNPSGEPASDGKAKS